MHNEFNILICGSQRFDDEPFVSGMLDETFSGFNGQIDNIIVSRFSGACLYAKEWAVYKNKYEGGKMGIREFSFDFKLEANDFSLYEQQEIPDELLARDPFFKNGSEALIASGAKAVVAFPNLEGVLGAATTNILRFAILADIPILDCSPALHAIYAATKEATKENSTIYVPEEKSLEEKMGLTNNNPRKKM